MPQFETPFVIVNGEEKACPFDYIICLLHTLGAKVYRDKVAPSEL